MSEMNPDDSPFSLSPDPKTFYVTPLLRTAFHKIGYVVQKRQGITAILGDYGLGKSSLIRAVFERQALDPSITQAIIPSPAFKSDYAFIRGICHEFGLPARRSVLDQQREFQAFVVGQYAENRNVVLLIDEGQSLDIKQLEIVRVLLNFETNNKKLVQIILAGQLELRDRLLDAKLGALRSRIFAPTLLSPLSLLETKEMINFRCEEYQVRNNFQDGAIDVLYELTGGIPREVLKTAAMAWLLTEITGDPNVTPDVMPAARREAALLDD